MLINLIVEIILKHTYFAISFHSIRISKFHIEHLKYTQYLFLNLPQYSW